MLKNYAKKLTCFKFLHLTKEFKYLIWQLFKTKQLRHEKEKPCTYLKRKAMYLPKTLKPSKHQVQTYNEINYLFNYYMLSFTHLSRILCKEFLGSQLHRGVPRKRCSENMLQIFRRTPIPKCDCFATLLKSHFL